jgi:hypothetical protein
MHVKCSRQEAAAKPSLWPRAFRERQRITSLVAARFRAVIDLGQLNRSEAH